MDQIIAWVKWVAAIVVGGLTAVFGPMDTLLSVLLVLVIIDYVTGVICAAVNGQLSSAIGFKGLAKKVGIFAIVAVAAMVDQVIPSVDGALRAAACAFYIANEGLSVLENWGNIGLPLPETLKKALAQLKDKSKDE